MRSQDADILIIPGLGNSGPDHWQSRWEAKLSSARRVVQEDWENPRFTEWTTEIAHAVARAQKPVVLVAHSLGVIAAAHAVPALDGKVAGGFLVAPPSERVIAEFPAIDRRFAPAPRARLPFPCVLVASRDDPYSFFHEAEVIAAAWGATLADAGLSGHINVESGHGPWPEGLIRFAEFLKRL